MIISGLGALNDVTITQASSAWELRAAMPLTTAIAAALATRPTQEQGRSRRRQLEERLARF